MFAPAIWPDVPVPVELQFFFNMKGFIHNFEWMLFLDVFGVVLRGWCMIA